MRDSSVMNIQAEKIGRDGLLGHCCSGWGERTLLTLSHTFA